MEYFTLPLKYLKKIEIVSKLLKNGGTVTIVLSESEKNLRFSVNIRLRGMEGFSWWKASPQTLYEL